MDYRELIIQLLEKADNKQLKYIYRFIRGFLGLG